MCILRVHKGEASQADKAEKGGIFGRVAKQQTTQEIKCCAKATASNMFSDKWKLWQTPVKGEQKCF